MGRVLFSEDARNEYFSSLRNHTGKSWEALAKDLHVCSRQLRDWRKGIASFPTHIATKIQERFNLHLPEDVVINKDYWYIAKAAQMGGKQRVNLHGPPGTAVGRRKGGLNSIKTHQLQNTGFVTIKAITLPKRSEKLAEFIGAVLGDGSITPLQVKISLNLKTDRAYGIIISNFIRELFDVNWHVLERKEHSVFDIVVSSRRLVLFLHEQGLPIGNKIKQGLDAPLWVHEYKSWQQACLRGLFDTDGCTYIDYHRYKEKQYAYVGVAFTSYSQPLLQSIGTMLRNLGYNPTVTTKKRILLRKEQEVVRFFKEIKPNNIRHEHVLKKFLEEYRSGHNGTVSKAVVV